MAFLTEPRIVMAHSFSAGHGISSIKEALELIVSYAAAGHLFERRSLPQIGEDSIGRRLDENVDPLPDTDAW